MHETHICYVTHDQNRTNEQTQKADIKKLKFQPSNQVACTPFLHR